MRIMGNGVGRLAWALVERETGVIRLSDVCETKAQAVALKKLVSVHADHRAACDVTPIVIRAAITSMGSGHGAA